MEKRSLQLMLCAGLMLVGGSVVAMYDKNPMEIKKSKSFSFTQEDVKKAQEELKHSSLQAKMFLFTVANMNKVEKIRSVHSMKKFAPFVDSSRHEKKAQTRKKMSDVKKNLESNNLNNAVVLDEEEAGVLVNELKKK